MLPDMGGDKRRELPDIKPGTHVPKPLAPVPEPEIDDPIGNIRSEAEARELKRLLLERARRKIEALRLYEPLPAQQAFHNSACRIRLVRGSNRSGKTLSSAVEFARIVTGQDFLNRCTKKDGRAFVVGKDLSHIGTVIHRKLFKAGAFKIVRDLVTKEWRAFRPWDAIDAPREAEAKPAPPLIPPRFVKSVAWEKKSESIPALITLTNGWEIHFLSSLGKPPQGQDLDMVWFDEEIVDGEWWPEMQARLLDRRGHFMWSATPQAGTDRLYELHLRCEKEESIYHASVAAGDPKPIEPTAREFKLLLADNPHFSEEDKRALANSYTDREYEVRIGGEFAIESSKVWPEFSIGVHGIDYFDVPHEWTRYAVIDPGRQICAVAFFACPPPFSTLEIPGDSGVRFTDEVVMIDELYIPNSDANEFGRRMHMKCSGQMWEAFIIDTHGGRFTEAGSGKTIEAQYRKALEENGVQSVRTGHGFAWGSDDVAGGLEAFRAWLKVRACGTPKFRVLRDKCPNFEWEIARYRYKRVNGLVTDDPESRGRVHLMATMRYLALYGPTWVAPKQGQGRLGGAVAAFRAKMARLRRQKGGGGAVVLGPTRGK